VATDATPKKLNHSTKPHLFYPGAAYFQLSKRQQQPEATENQIPLRCFRLLLFNFQNQ
jgi:hypothetical protein